MIRAVRPLLVLAALSVATALAGLSACGDDAPPDPSGPGGTGGAGGCGAIDPTHPLITLTIRADEGPVPPDTRLRVSWSAGEEQEFRLDDPETWATLDESNVVCDVDRDAGPPDALSALVCELWTNGATRVVVSADGYVTRDETFTPEFDDECDLPVPAQVAVELREDD